MIDLKPYVKVKTLDDELYKDKRYRKMMILWGFGLGVSLTLFFGGIILNLMR